MRRVGLQRRARGQIHKVRQGKVRYSENELNGWDWKRNGGGKRRHASLYQPKTAQETVGCLLLVGRGSRAEKWLYGYGPRAGAVKSTGTSI